MPSSTGSRACRARRAREARRLRAKPARRPLRQSSPNCVTNNSTGTTPSDIHGAAGPTNIVTVTNVDIGVYNKSTCALVTREGLTTLMGAASGESLFDPQVLWDNTNGRFIVTADSCFGSCTQGATNQNEWFAVSKDSTGTSWFVYQIQIINGTTTFCLPDKSYFWDYPHVGSINGGNPRWMITANVFPSSGIPTGALITIPKTPTLTGGAVTLTCFSNLLFGIAATNVLDSNNTAYLLSPFSGSGNSITRYALRPGSPDTLTTTSPISITAWTAPPGAPMPGSTEVLDTSDGRFVSQTIQRGTRLWNVHSINLNNLATGRLYQFSTTGTSPLFTTDLFTSPNDFIFNLSVAVNASQAFVNASRTTTASNAAMVIFNGPNSSSSGWVSLVTDVSTASYNNCSSFGMVFCRWGDYSATQIDPSNRSNAWGFNQLITGTDVFTGWGTHGTLVSGPPVGCVAPTDSHDFNGDCLSDIAWRDSNSGTVAGWLMNGLQTLQSGGYGPVANNWQIVGQGDFNGDGIADLLWRDSNTGTPAIWLLAPNFQVLQKGVFAAVDNNWVIAGTGDFNGDGKGDIIWFHNPTGTVAVWLLNGFSTPQTGILGPVPSGWAIVGTGDFNSDGMTDILWYHAASGTVAIWLMNGLSVLQTGTVGVLSGWTVAGTGDFNGDGKSDILWYHSPSGTVGVWLLNGMNVLQTGTYGVVATNWQIAETGDFNGDGKSDILWRDMSMGGGTVAIWLLNGLQVLQTGTLARPRSTGRSKA